MTAFHTGSRGMREARIEKVQEALADGRRLTVTDMLKFMPKGTSYATLSLLLRELKEEGMVAAEPRGKNWGNRECEYWLVAVPV